MIEPESTDEIRAAAAANLLDALELETDRDTPTRMARALADLTSGGPMTPAALRALLRTFPAGRDPGLVVVRAIPFASVCEHHVLPFSGTVDVVYIPRKVIVGLSKIPRLVRVVTRRLQVQERIGQQVADALAAHLKPRGVMVVVRGRHSCMALRGIESPGDMVTSCVRGAFAREAAARAEALALMGAAR